MPNQTTNFSFNKPLVNDAVDEDLWGGQLNDNWDSIDTLLDQFIPIGIMFAYAGTAAPNAKWLLCDGSAVSRTTYADLFTLVSTSYGIGDGSTTFNLPDYRGRAGIGLDNLGSSSADRVTDANADSLNNTGGGDEDDTSTISGSVTSHVLTEAEMPANLTMDVPTADVNDAGTARLARGLNNGVATTSIAFTSVGSGTAHPHSDTFAISGTATNTQPWIAEGRIIRAL